MSLNLNDCNYTNQHQSFKQLAIVSTLFIVFSPITCPFKYKTNSMPRIIVLLFTMWLLATLTVNIDCRILREPHLQSAKSFHAPNDWEDRYAELPIKKRFHVANVWDEPDEY
ncbi:hypothetical protein EG68_00523 [Paragonimus skrjabini miyazakii]|uniref:Uncharacterized protein n=1 Tax=Paragonimus skrjabini miyazakii TaxID=59628 RepID=A0A8S9ZA26_9TREM|nr:hypothetical protein EG68_00523 [Paragonimus skrjabini miyazakii]